MTFPQRLTLGPGFDDVVRYGDVWLPSKCVRMTPEERIAYAAKLRESMR